MYARMMENGKSKTVRKSENDVQTIIGLNTAVMMGCAYNRQLGGFAMSSGARLASCIMLLMLISASFASIRMVEGSASFENYPVYFSGASSQNKVRIAVGPYGDIYAVWVQANTVVFSNSSDGGKTWRGAPLAVMLLSGGTDFSIAVDIDDNVYVAAANINDVSYPSDRWGVKRLIKYADGSMAFEYADASSHGTQTISDVGLATGGAHGSAYAYMVYKTTDVSGYQVIRARKSTAWSSEISIVTGVSGVILSYPSVAIYDNKVAVAYNRNNADILLALNEGGGFTTVSINIGSSTYTSIAFEQEDIYIAWRQVSDLKVCHYYHDAAWSVRVKTTVDDGTTTILFPKLAIDKRGSVFVAWHETKYTEYGNDVYYDVSTDNATSFSTDVKANRDYSGASAQYFASICAEYGYGPYLAWEDVRTGAWKIFFEDIGLGKPYNIEQVSNIGGVALPEYRINDIINYTGTEIEGDTVNYDSSTNVWVTRNPASVPSARSEHSLASFSGASRALLFGGYDATGYDGETWIYDQSTTTWTQRNPIQYYLYDSSYNQFSPGTFTNTEVEGYAGLDGTVVLANSIGATWVVSSSFSTAASSLTYDLLWVQSGVTLTLTSTTGCTINVDTLIIDGTLASNAISSTTNAGNGLAADSTNGAGGGGGGGYGGAGGTGATGANSLGGTGTKTGGGGGASFAGLSMGRRGGSGGASFGGVTSGTGGYGGGMITINARSFTISGTGRISANGGNGNAGSYYSGGGGGGGGGGGSGGGIQINCYTFSGAVGSVIEARGGSGGNGAGQYTGGGGGGGGGGRIFVYYEASYSMSGSYSTAGGISGTGGFSGSNGAAGVTTSGVLSYTSPLTYQATGDFTAPYDFISSGVGSWGVITWGAQLKGGGSISFQLRSSNTLSGLYAAAFIGPDGTSSSYYTASGTAITNLPNGYYVQYKAYFTRGALSTDFVAVTEVRVYYYTSSPSPRVGHAMSYVDDDDKVLLFGGNDGERQYGDTYTYDYSNGYWSTESTGPLARTEHAMASITGTNKVLLFGGWCNNAGVEFRGDTWVYDVSTDSWTELAIAGPSPRAGHAMAAIDDTSGIYRSIILFGGYDASGILGDTWQFIWDTVTGTGAWMRLSGFLTEPNARSNHAMSTMFSSKKVMLYGGENDRSREDAWVFDLASKTWTRVANGTMERTGHAMTMIDTTNYALVFGGNSTNHYTVLGGEGYVSVIKCSANNPKLTNVALVSAGGGASCIVNAMTIRWGKVIAAGRSSVGCEVWEIDMRDDSLASSTSLSGYDWNGWYSEFSEVCYQEGEGIMIFGARLTAVYGGGPAILKIGATYSNRYHTSMSYLPNAICPNGTTTGYYIFAYDAANSVNKYYTQNGALDADPVEFVPANGPRGRIEDAKTVTISASPVKTFTYLAASSSIQGSTRGLYKMTCDGGVYTMSEIDVNGDGNCYYFNYSAIDVCPNAAIGADSISILAAGANYYTRLPTTGAVTGFFTAITEKFDGASWSYETIAFENMTKNEFCATKILDHKFNVGVEGLVGGLTNSPSLFAIKSAVTGSFTLITLYSLDPPTASNVRIALPGDPSTTNRMNEQFAPTGATALEFWVDITEPDTLSDLQSVKLQAWYDDPNGDGIEDAWDAASAIDDKNARLQITCTRLSAGAYAFEMDYPTSSEVAFDPSNCSATENGNTLRLKYCYIPLKQARYSHNGTYNDGTSSVSTWNFQYVCTDGVGERPPIGGALGDGFEFGFQKVTSLVGVVDRMVKPGDVILPGTYGTTSEFSIGWSTNNDYKVSVSMSTPLSDGVNTIDYKNVMAREARNATAGYAGADFSDEDNTFGLDGYRSFDTLGTKVHWYGSDDIYWDAPRSGSEQAFDTNFIIYVPIGTGHNMFRATLTYTVEISDVPCAPRIMNEIAVLGTGALGSDYYGYSAASAGDVNGDGFDDVIVGAYGNDDSFLNAGKAYVYYGSPAGVSAAAYWVAFGEYSSDFFGWSVSSAGDVNGDGYDDVIIGAYSAYYSATSLRPGKAYIYYGSASGLSGAPTVLIGDAGDDYFGYSVSSAGDVNGDGFDDVIVGAYGNDEAGGLAGKAYVFKGGPGGLDTNAIWLGWGEVGGDYYGRSVAGAGDVNGDGYDDIIVGAYGYDLGGLTNRGKVYVYHGSSSGVDPGASWTRIGDLATDYFGHSVSSAGDVNGDGLDDVLVGAYNAYNTVTSTRSGKSYVFLGDKTGMSATSFWEVAGEAASDYFGGAIASSARINGDGYADIIVGARYNDTPSTTDNRGKAYLFRGSPGGPATTTMEYGLGEGASNYFGACVACAGDVNGDGYDDIIVGAYGYNSLRGRVYIYT